MRKDLSKAEQEEAAKEFGETMQALPLAQWQKLHDEYYERTKR